LIAATLNEAVPLQILAGDGRADLHGEVRLYNPAGALVATVPLTHLQEGLYGATWTPGSEGFFSAVYQFYMDPSLTIDAGYSKGGELIEVSQTKTNILRLLGLVHENSVVDQQQYDPDGNLIQARIRCYRDRASAEAAGSSGLQFLYEVFASYTNGLLDSYRIVRET
jgi:hypothetical protein